MLEQWMLRNDSLHEACSMSFLPNLLSLLLHPFVLVIGGICQDLLQLLPPVIKGISIQFRILTFRVTYRFFYLSFVYFEFSLEFINKVGQSFTIFLVFLYLEVELLYAAFCFPVVLISFLVTSLERKIFLLKNLDNFPYLFAI